MNSKQIGNEFETEAYDILSGIFQSVEWLSLKDHKSAFDFKCVDISGKILYGDAKVINSTRKPRLSPRQKDADFIITKKKQEINIIYKKDFKDKVLFGLGRLMQIEDDTWEDLNKRKRRGETFDDIIKRALLEIPDNKVKTK